MVTLPLPFIDATKKSAINERTLVLNEQTSKIVFATQFLLNALVNRMNKKPKLIFNKDLRQSERHEHYIV